MLSCRSRRFNIDQVSGTISVIFDAESGRARQKIATKQSDYLDEVVSSQRVAIDRDNILEVFVVQGSASKLRGLCDDMRSIKGVKQLQLFTGFLNAAAG